MTEEPTNVDGEDEVLPPSSSRLRLLWDALVFQLKLAADGTRDLVLIPVSIGATLLGLVFGGDQPDRYLRRVLIWGRKTEIWINLFGHRHRTNTSDQLLDPIQQRVFNEMENNPKLRRASEQFDRTLDQVGAALQNPEGRPPKDP